MSRSDLAIPIKARVFEQKLEDIEEDEYKSGAEDARRALVNYLFGEMKKYWDLIKKAADEVENERLICARAEDSAYAFEISGHPDESDFGVMAALRGEWHEADYKSQELRKKLWAVIAKSKHNREALWEELKDAFKKHSPTAEQDFLKLSEDLDIPGTTEVLCRNEYWDTDPDTATDNE